MASAVMQSDPKLNRRGLFKNQLESCMYFSATYPLERKAFSFSTHLSLDGPNLLCTEWIWNCPHAVNSVQHTQIWLSRGKRSVAAAHLRKLSLCHCFLC